MSTASTIKKERDNAVVVLDYDDNDNNKKKD